jgi:hypothetical protein
MLLLREQAGRRAISHDFQRASGPAYALEKPSAGLPWNASGGEANVMFTVCASGFAVVFGAGAAALPAAAGFRAATEPQSTISAIHDVAVSLIALSGLFGAGLVLAGAMLDRNTSGKKLTLFQGLSIAALVGELAAPVGLLTLTGPLNPYDGKVTLVAALVFIIWAATFAWREARDTAR